VTFPIDLQTAITIDDFTVRLVDGAEGGPHVELASAARGRLAWFPAWDHADRDLRHFIPSDVPLGTVDHPYDDRDEGWRIAIFEHDGWIYVAEGDDPAADAYQSVVRVHRDAYLRAWALLIDRFNPITPLEKIFDET
jgi:hypothetical protein